MQGMPDSVKKYKKNRRYLRGKTYFFYSSKIIYSCTQLIRTHLKRIHAYCRIDFVSKIFKPLDPILKQSNLKGSPSFAISIIKHCNSPAIPICQQLRLKPLALIVFG